MSQSTIGGSIGGAAGARAGALASRRGGLPHRTTDTAWDPTTQPVDYVLLGGQVTPGVAEIEGAQIQHLWKERRMFGGVGALLRYTGRALCHFKITFRLASSQHFVDWDAFRRFLESKQLPPPATSLTGLPRMPPLDLVHPIPNQLGIGAVVIESIGQLEAKSELGEWTVTLAVIEYRPPQVRVAAAAGATNGPSTDPVDRVLEDLTSQLQVESHAP